MRTTFQGVWNILRFNWHFYALSLGFLVVLCVLAYLFSALSMYCVGGLVVLPTIISLAVSYYVYDVSGFYGLEWLENSLENHEIININAGFDETSGLLQVKFPNANLSVIDFYNPAKHTEISIKRARKAYPSFPNTIAVATTHLPFADSSTDQIFIIFAAHEIRKEQERIAFFKELNRILKATGQIIIVEHLRDTANLWAYTIGFLHFYSKNTWIKTLTAANFQIQNEAKHTPFISIFTIIKNGNTNTP